MTDENARQVRVLLLEDSPAFAFLIEEYLTEADPSGYAVHHAEYLADALKALSLETFDVILMDQSLPDSDATATLGAVTEHAGDTPIIVLSGSPIFWDAGEAPELEAAGYLSKRDVSPDTLAQTIREVLQR
jgi:putative two-component system response regulator